MNAYTSRGQLLARPHSSFSHAHRHRRPSLAARVADYFRRQSTRNELRQLTDRELADIGLSRSEVAHVFDVGFMASNRS